MTGMVFLAKIETLRDHAVGPRDLFGALDLYLKR